MTIKKIISVILLASVTVGAAAACGFFFGASCGRIESNRAMTPIDALNKLFELNEKARRI